MLTHIKIDRYYPIIERNIPAPPPKCGRGAKAETTNLLEAMIVGDSVWFPQPEAIKRRVVASKIGKRDGKTFIGRKMPKDGRDGLRIWRTA